MGNGCSLHRGRVAPAQIEFTGARRVIFCGLGRSGKTTLVDWVIQWNRASLAAANANGDGNEETKSDGNVPDRAGAIYARAANPPPVPDRTQHLRVCTLPDESLVLVDTPGIICDEDCGSLSSLPPGTMSRAGAIVFVVDITDPIRGILARDTFLALLRQQLPRTRQGTPVLLLANWKFKSQTPAVDVSAWVSELQVPCESEMHAKLAEHFAIKTMMFSNADDVAKIADKIMGSG